MPRRDSLDIPGTGGKTREESTVFPQIVLGISSGSLLGISPFSIPMRQNRTIFYQHHILGNVLDCQILACNCLGHYCCASRHHSADYSLQPP